MLTFAPIIYCYLYVRKLSTCARIIPSVLVIFSYRTPVPVRPGELLFPFSQRQPVFSQCYSDIFRISLWILPTLPRQRQRLSLFPSPWDTFILPKLLATLFLIFAFLAYLSISKIAFMFFELFRYFTLILSSLFQKIQHFIHTVFLKALCCMTCILQKRMIRWHSQRGQSSFTYAHGLLTGGCTHGR